MVVLISGICGFVGSSVAKWLLSGRSNMRIIGFDNLSRAGSHLNRAELERLGIKVFHADARMQSDLDALPRMDWIIDAAANPSVLAGIDGVSSTRQVVETNLIGTINLLELAKKHGAGFILLSTSRVYSIDKLRNLPLAIDGDRYAVDPKHDLPEGLTAAGIAENFSTAAPISIYGGTKLSSEIMAMEYAAASAMPLWINRCGVLAGAGQFGKPDQGIVAYWIHAYRAKRPLRYNGFDGLGLQVRDCLHPSDLARLIDKQMNGSSDGRPRVCNIGGGLGNSISLKELSTWCSQRFGKHEVACTREERAFDLAWIVMDSSLAQETWQFERQVGLNDILEEIAEHAQTYPNWLDICAR